jgi:hypothetical protein
VVSEDILYGPPAIGLVTDDRRLTITIPPDGSRKVARLWELDDRGWETRELSEDPAFRQETIDHAKRLEGLRGSLDPVAAAATTAIEDPDTFDKLRALGYVE